ncbi:transcription factor MYBS3-like [Musa acuminata AAA Group]|uniref:transcription factor MYBS3-like n=1 Tax=Musa acuminata AAA Group TaxID=214697 RepID=UPI0031DDE602
MTRRCSHCSHDDHNSRTCPNRGVKLFGVRLTDGSIRKSASMGNLSIVAGCSGGVSPADGSEPGCRDGYASEDFAKGSSASCRERKKGNPWTEEEHMLFLLGLQKLGKGDWRGISRNYVVSRSPTQVASHAQKYFIRKANTTRRKRRSSLFDMEPDEPLEAQPSLMNFQESEAQNNKPLPVPPTLNEDFESMDSNDEKAVVPQPEALQCSYPVLRPAYFSPFLQLSFPHWSGDKADTSEQQAHEIIKPTAVHLRTPINVDELVGMSKLSIGESAGETASSLFLLGGSKRQSAFHANPSTRAHT